MNRIILLIVLLALPAMATPRDVRRVLKENHFSPGDEIKRAAIAYPEPTMQTWPIGDGQFVTEFDPPPTNPKALTAEQTRQLAAILAGPHTYNPSLGGKACGAFHADVAIRIQGYKGGLYVLLCFTCNEIVLRQWSRGVASADMDRGRNRLLLFIRSILPNNKHFKELRLYKHEELERNWTTDVLEWAKTTIPDDPLLKDALKRKPEEVTEDELEELDIRCAAQMNKWREEEAAQRKKEDQTNAPK